jgi:hypothetical protein
LPNTVPSASGASASGSLDNQHARLARAGEADRAIVLRQESPSASTRTS